MDRPDKTERKPSPSPKLDQRREAGVACRREVSLETLAKWQPAPNRRDPVDILVEQGETRIPELLPVRYARMRADPFAFLRGAAAVMAADLGSTPATRLRVQSCGDCHLAIFWGVRVSQRDAGFRYQRFR